MFKTFIESAGELIKNPFTLIPAVCAMVVNLFVLSIASEAYFNVIYEVILFGNVGDSIIELPLYLFASYGKEIFIIAGAMFLTLAIGYYLTYVYAKVLAEKEAVIPAMIKTLGNAGELIGITLFAFVMFFIYATITYFLIVISFTVEIIGLFAFIILLTWFFFGAYAYFKFMFTPIIMVVKKQKLKIGLATSWKWSEKKIISIMVLLLVMGFITGIVGDLFLTLGSAFEQDFEIIALIILALGIGITSTFYHITLIKYFLTSEN